MNRILTIFFITAIFAFGDSFTGERIKIDYRGGNGAFSPDGKWYASLWDGENKRTKEMYLHFQIFDASGSSRGGKYPSFDAEGKTPVVDILMPYQNINVRGMKMVWSEDSKVFTADQDWLGSFTYNLNTHNFSKNKG